MTDLFSQLHRIASSCNGYLIDRLSLSRIEERDGLEIGLRWGPEKPDITLSFGDIYYFSISREPSHYAQPLDNVTAIELPPSDEPWPAALRVNVARSSSLPILLWFRAEGPVELDVVAAGATVLVESK